MFVPLLNIHSWRSTGTGHIYACCVCHAWPDIRVVFGFPSILNWDWSNSQLKSVSAWYWGKTAKAPSAPSIIWVESFSPLTKYLLDRAGDKKGLLCRRVGGILWSPRLPAAGEISPDIWPDLVDRMSGQIKRVCQYDLDNNELQASQNRGSLASTPLSGFSTHTLNHGKAFKLPFKWGNSNGTCQEFCVEGEFGQ